MPDHRKPRAAAGADAIPCDHCAGRGWGLRQGFVRRCEVCCRFRDDAAARVAAQPELARFALRELPTAHVPPDTGAMRCPWCNHLPTNEDIDTFWQIDDGTVYARARVGRLGPERSGDEPDDPVLLLGADTLDEDSCIQGEIRLLCPNPTCGKTFTVPGDLELESDPEEKVWNGREWVRSEE